jgi:hypothetical protein
MIGYVPVAVSVNPVLYLKFDASVKGSAHLKCEYNYSNWFRAGVRWDGNWKTFSDFEEQENEFTMFKPELTFSAEAGIALFLGTEVIIDEVAGPEVGVGPRLSAEANLSISPDGLDWGGEVKLTVQAWGGAKLKVLGYELAEWHKTFDIVGPWTILKFPSDGSEHKSFKKERSEYIETEIDKMVKIIDKKYDNTFMNRIEQVVMMKMALNGGTHDECLKEIYEGFCDVLYGKMRNQSVAAAESDHMKALEADADNAEVRQRIFDWFKKIENDVRQSYENKDAREYSNQIRDAILASPQIPDNLRNDGYSYSYVSKAMMDFRNEFNREPEINQKDFQWLIDRTIKYYMQKMFNPASRD